MDVASWIFFSPLEFNKFFFFAPLIYSDAQDDEGSDGIVVMTRW